MPALDESPRQGARRDQRRQDQRRRRGWQGRVHAGLLVALLVLSTAIPAQASCNYFECIKQCDAECVGAYTFEAMVACTNACRGWSCSDQASCERRLGYRDTIHGGAHLSYGIGGAPIPGAVDRGFRHHVELAGAVGPGKDWLSLGNSITGSLEPTTGWLFGASGLLGIGSSPSYALVEGGYGSGLYAALGGFLGVGARLERGMTPIVGLRSNLDVLLLNLGVRTLASFERRPDLLICLTLGLGRY